MKYIYINKLILIFLLSFFFVLSDVDAATIVKPANNLGLVGYWSFNDATSTQATDFSGRGNIGTLNTFSAPATASSGWGNGKFGPGLNFDGSSDYVSIDGVANDVVETSFAFSVWIKSTWTAGFDTVLAINTAGLGNQTQLFIDSNLTIRVYDGTQDATELSSSGSVVDGRWHHVVYSRSGATGTLYVDGVSQGTHNSSDTFTGTDLWSLGQEFDAGPTPSDLYAGGMDDVRIYNRPLSGTEVLNLYNSGLITVGSANAQRNIVTSGLIGYWTLDGGEMTATTAYDRSTSANTLSLLSGPMKTVGKIGQSINMDAVDDQLFCTDANCGGTTGGKMDMGTRDWTAMAWIKPEAGGTNCNVRGTVAGKIGDDEIGWYIGIGNQYICSEISGTSNISSTLDGSQVPLNEWSHIAVVFDRDGNMTRYLNGVQTGTQDSISANNGDSVDHPHNFCIGARDGAGGCLERLFDGSIDEVRIYERVLTAGEIKQVYNAGVGTKVNASQNTNGGSLNSGLVGLWSFNGPDTSGTTAYDRSGNGNDGTLTSGASKTLGKVGQGISFSGANLQYVTIPNGGGLNNLQTGSISLWAKWTGTQDEDSDPGGKYGAILARQSNGVFSNQVISLDSANPATAHIRFAAYTNNPFVTSSAVAGEGRWRHIVVTYQSGSQTMYIDGIQDGTDTATGSMGNNAAVPLTIGGWIGDGGSYSSSVVDEVRIYNRIITPSEIKQLYLMGR